MLCGCLQLGARLQRLGPEDAQFIYNACGEHCVDVATHRHGCCVMQRCLDFANPQHRAELVERIQVAVALPVRTSIKDVYDDTCTELLVTSQLDSGAAIV